MNKLFIFVCICAFLIVGCSKAKTETPAVTDTTKVVVADSVKADSIKVDTAKTDAVKK
jgi:uncharacterized protein YcfL